MNLRTHRLGTILTLCLIIGCSPAEEKEKWTWDSEIFAPRLVIEGSTASYEVDTLRPTGRFRAKLYKAFTTFNDSLGNNIIKEFKGYFFQIALDTSRRSGVEYPYKKINKFIDVVNDTAFIDIPSDSILKYDGKIMKWRTGYRIIFSDNSDTTYMTGGVWYMDRNAR